MPNLHRTGRTICCIGEALWDALPKGLFLGGAPLNVCCHLNMLGEQALMVSRVGTDRLGHEILRRLKSKDIPVDYIQQDNRTETGIVEVSLMQKESPDYEIIEPAAWDFISYTEEVQKLAATADIVVFGTLGQRNEVSRQTIRQIINQHVLTIYDVNLRSPFDDPSIVEHSLRETDVIKMNEEELMTLADWFGYPQQTEKAVEKLVEVFGCQQICITRGKDGSVLYNRGSWTWQEPFEVEVKDTVGPGDAFLAALIFGMSHFKTDRERLRFASLLGAFVTTKQGAIPSYSLKEIENFALEKGALVDLASQ